MYIIAGLGNPTKEYEHTRHNVGFDTIDVIADRFGIGMGEKKHKAIIGKGHIEGNKVILVKPQTYMNLSGNAVRYWKEKEGIDLNHILVLVDDLALPFGAIRIKGKGSDGGHNGLKNIAALLGTQNYARIRFGVGNEFVRGAQIDYVLGNFTEEQSRELPDRMKVACDAIKAFCLSGLTFAMNNFSNK